MSKWEERRIRLVAKANGTKKGGRTRLSVIKGGDILLGQPKQGSFKGDYAD